MLDFVNMKARKQFKTSGLAMQDGQSSDCDHIT